MKKRLFNEHGQYTSAGQSFHGMIGMAVEQVIRDWHENNWDIRDMESIASAAILEQIYLTIFSDTETATKQQPEQSHPQQQEP